MKKKNTDADFNDSFGSTMTYSYGKGGQHEQLLTNEKANFKILHTKVRPRIIFLFFLLSIMFSFRSKSSEESP